MNLYGRADELRMLCHRLELTAEGRGQLLFVEGERGIGKSRLLAEVVMWAQDHHFQVIRGVPEEGRREELARDRPFLFTVEDLHWADPSTLLAVRSLGRRSVRAPIAVIATFRSYPHQPELDQLLEACSGDGTLQLTLPALDEEAVAGLVTEAAGAPPGPRLRSRVRSAGGNPLLVTLLVAALARDGAITVSGGTAEIEDTLLSPALRLTILQGLRGLPAATLQVLRLASLLGPAFSLTDLSVASGQTSVELFSALEPARTAGLLGEGGAQLRFRHELVREALYDDLPLSVREALHRDVGRALALGTEYPVSARLALCLVETDDLERAAAVIAEAQRSGEGEALRWVSRLRAFLAGEWDEAVADSDGIAYDVLALIAFHRGDLQMAEAHVKAAGGKPGSHRLGEEWLALAQAHTLEAAGRPSAALAGLSAAISRSPVPRRPVLGPDMVRLALSEGQRDLARAVTEAVEETAQKIATASAEGAALRCRGLLEDDADVLVEATEVYRKSPQPLARASAFEDAARACQQAGRKDEAIAFLYEALELYQPLGARLDIARIQALLRSLGQRPRRRRKGGPRVGWDSLTGTEVEVVRLVAEGLTNREVGRRLFVSPRTVETHLSHVFAKLGLSSRIELIVAAARNPERLPAPR